MPVPMLRALFLSIRQLDDRRIAMVFAKSFAITLLIFAGLGGAFVWGTRSLVAGWLHQSSAMADLAGAAAVLLVGLGMWLLFRLVALAVLGIFADEVVEAVEARYYPDAAGTVRPVPLRQSIAMGLGAALRALVVNILLIPFYLGLLLTGIGTAALFFVVNSWLLGRDLGDMVAARHLDMAGMKQWRNSSRIGRLMLGGIGTGLLIVPVVNLVMPVIGAAMATHLYHQSRRKAVA